VNTPAVVSPISPTFRTSFSHLSFFCLPGGVVKSPHHERSLLCLTTSPYHSQVLDCLSLVAGMFDELGIADVIDQAVQQHPEMRDLTVGEGVKAMVLR
jgi:hypothetical protein